jgi:hypothetical protein
VTDEICFESDSSLSKVTPKFRNDVEGGRVFPLKVSHEAVTFDLYSFDPTRRYSVFEALTMRRFAVSHE